jgi:hypothetical protein
MNHDEYRQALIDRGFHFNSDVDRWIGPYNIMVTDLLTHDLRSFTGTARDEAIAVIDEQLRAARGGPRPPSSGGPGGGLL